MRQLICLVITVLCLFSTSALAWWNEEWPYRVPVRLDAAGAQNPAQTEKLENAVILLRLHAGNFQDFFLLKEDLSDLRIIANDDKTPLEFHVEKFDLLNQHLFIWVKIPELRYGDKTQKIWMYYGNANAVSAQNPQSTYDASEVAVYLFNEMTATTTTMQAGGGDVTAYQNHADLQSLELVEASFIATGGKFSGDSRLVMSSQAFNVWNSQEGMTFSAWIKPEVIASRGMIFSRANASGSQHIALMLESGNVVAQIDMDGQQIRSNPVPATMETWQHLAVVVAKENLTIVLNGESVANMSLPGALILDSDLYVGKNTGDDGSFTGEIDTISISKTARSLSALAVAANNQGREDKISLLEPAEQLGSGGGSKGFFNVLLTSTGIEGWVILFLLFVMAFFSWIVMGAKGMYLGYASRDNRKFLLAYEKLRGRSPDVLDHADDEKENELQNSPILQAFFGKHDHFQSSPVYHLYHRGINEVRERLASNKSGLTVEATNAIRASLDAQLTREVQKLNSHMVLLTIAISGGPFLGLLGTVVGVMITFAAIAATGDVNIAAIAPGVAAALLTTVAGLVVAIPALFAYNYLSSRIKEGVVEMRVFNDEFITRLAEYYGVKN